MFNVYKWTEKYIKPLEGRTIVKTSVEKDGNFPILHLDNGWKLVISQDEEFNGAGFIDGLPDVSG